MFESIKKKDRGVNTMKKPIPVDERKKKRVSEYCRNLIFLP